MNLAAPPNATAMPAGSTAALQCRGVHCRLGTRDVLLGVDLPDLPSGQLVALLGPNGSGKSSLLRSMAGVTPARFDSLKVDGRDIAALPASRRADLLRYLPQSPPAPLHLSVNDALRVPLHSARGLSLPRDDTARVARILQDLGIGHLADRFLDELSGGQRQLVGLAQTLVHRPRVLLLDEPLASLDLNYQFHVITLLRRWAHEYGLLVIVVLHDLDVALRHADAALVLHQGRLVSGGPPLDAIDATCLEQVFGVRAQILHTESAPPRVLIHSLTSL